MVPRGLILKVLRLQKTGMSERKIATDLHLSRTVIAQIRERSRKQKRLTAIPEPPAPRKVDTYWCHGCEAWVILRPCVACMARIARRMQTKRMQAKRLV